MTQQKRLLVVAPRTAPSIIAAVRAEVAEKDRKLLEAELMSAAAWQVHSVCGFNQDVRIHAPFLVLVDPVWSNYPNGFCSKYLRVPCEIGEMI